MKNYGICTFIALIAAGFWGVFFISFQVGILVFMGVSIITAFIIKPELGLILMAIIVPLNLSVPKNYSILVGVDSLTLLEILVPILFILFIVSNAWEINWKYFKKLAPSPMLVYFGVLTLTYVNAQFKFEFFSQMTKWIMYFSCFVIYTFYFRESRWRARLISGLIVSGGILMLITIIPYLLRLQVSKALNLEILLPSMIGELRRFTSTYYQPNHLGAYLGFLVSLQAGIILGVKRNGSIPVHNWIISIITGFGLVLTLSRGAWIALIVTLLVGLTISRKDSRIYRILLVCIMVAMVAQVFLPSNLLPARIQDLLNLESSDLSARISLWQGAWVMFMNNPVLGVGVGNFGPLYWKFWETGMLYVEEQWAVSAHNMYLQVLATSGIMGLASFLWFLFHFLKNGYTITKQDPSNVNKDNLLGLYMGFVFFCVHGLVDNYYSYVPSFLMVFISASLMQSTRISFQE